MASAANPRHAHFWWAALARLHALAWVDGACTHGGTPTLRVVAARAHNALVAHAPGPSLRAVGVPQATQLALVCGLVTEHVVHVAFAGSHAVGVRGARRRLAPPHNALTSCRARCAALTRQLVHAHAVLAVVLVSTVRVGAARRA